MNMIRTLLLFSCVFCAICVRAEAPATKPAIQKVTPGEFEKLLADKDAKADVVLLDVRTPEEYANGHIAGATNLNYRDKEFAQKVGQLDKSKTYLVYCAVGGRSTGACEKMAKLDFLHLYNLDGGIGRWQREGKKVEK